MDAGIFLSGKPCSNRLTRDNLLSKVSQAVFLSWTVWRIGTRHFNQTRS